MKRSVAMLAGAVSLSSVFFAHAAEISGKVIKVNGENVVIATQGAARAGDTVQILTQIPKPIRALHARASVSR